MASYPATHPGAYVSSAREQLKSLMTDQQHDQEMRARALHLATLVLLSPVPEAQNICDEVRPAGQNRTYTQMHELLANHYLTYIETGKFLT